MSTILEIRVRADYPWDSAQVDGIRFNKREPVQRAADNVSAGILESPILEIVTIAADDTPAAEAEIAAPDENPQAADDAPVDEAETPSPRAKRRK